MISEYFILFDKDNNLITINGIEYPLELFDELSTLSARRILNAIDNVLIELPVDFDSRIIDLND